MSSLVDSHTNLLISSVIGDKLDDIELLEILCGVRFLCEENPESIDTWCRFGEVKALEGKVDVLSRSLRQEAFTSVVFD